MTSALNHIFSDSEARPGRGPMDGQEDDEAAHRKAVEDGDAMMEDEEDHIRG